MTSETLALIPVENKSLATGLSPFTFQGQGFKAYLADKHYSLGKQFMDLARTSNDSLRWIVIILRSYDIVLEGHIGIDSIIHKNDSRQLD